MKKLIINEKNLPKIGKTSDSSIRIRINKSQSSQEKALIQKSIPTTLHDIDTCIQTLHKAINGSSNLDEEHKILITQLLKQYRQVLNPNMELMSQSFKFSKLKLKTGIDTEEKENCPVLVKIQKKGKEIAISDRISRLADKTQIMPTNKSQKNRKLVLMRKNNSERLQTVTDQSEKSSAQMRRESIKDENAQLASSRESKVDQEKIADLSAEFLYESIVMNDGLSSVQEPRIKYLEDQVLMLTKSVKQKTEEIEELHERIQQLGVNVQNLIKKNSQKSQEYSKLQEENAQLIETIKNSSARSESNEEIKLVKLKCKKLEDQKTVMQVKKEELEKKLRILEGEKEEKKQQELGRYETAQHFYELTRRDLRQENENLMTLLEERERQLANLYQVVGFGPNVPYTAGSKPSPRQFIAV